MKLGTWVVRGPAVTFAFLFLAAAWYPEAAILMLMLGAITIGLAFVYGNLGGKDVGVLFGLGVVFLIGSALVDNVRSAVQIASVIILATAIVWVLVRWESRRHQRRQQNRERERLASWQGNWR